MTSAERPAIAETARKGRTTFTQPTCLHLTHSRFSPRGRQP